MSTFEEINPLDDRGKVHHTCLVLCLGICLYEGDYLVHLQSVPVVPFVLLVKVYPSVLVNVITSNDIHCSGLRCVVYCTAVAKRERKVVYWPSYWLPEAGEMKGKFLDADFLGIWTVILYNDES
jgi:hypothetical protein